MILNSSQAFNLNDHKKSVFQGLFQGGLANCGFVHDSRRNHHVQVVLDCEGRMNGAYGGQRFHLSSRMSFCAIDEINCFLI